MKSKRDSGKSFRIGFLLVACDLADRAMVLSKRPSTVQSVVSVPLERPRNLSDPQFLEIRDRILSAIGLGKPLETVSERPVANSD